MDIGGLRFLVVEDHRFQRWLANLLEGWAPQRSARRQTGRGPRRPLGPRPPVDVVVSDLDMPGMDGMELMRHIAAHRRRASLIVVTSMDPKVALAVETMARALNVPVPRHDPEAVHREEAGRAARRARPRRKLPRPS